MQMPEVPNLINNTFIRGWGNVIFRVNQPNPPSYATASYNFIKSIFVIHFYH